MGLQLETWFYWIRKSSRKSLGMVQTFTSITISKLSRVCSKLQKESGVPNLTVHLETSQVYGSISHQDKGKPWKRDQNLGSKGSNVLRTDKQGQGCPIYLQTIQRVLGFVRYLWLSDFHFKEPTTCSGKHIDLSLEEAHKKPPPKKEKPEKRS